MDKNAIKKYAVWARNELIARVTQKAEQYEITAEKITPADADSIGGRLLTDTEKNQRKALIEKIRADGFEQVMEEVAYTWFNRFTALRFMEVNNYLPSRTRVFTNEAGEFKPQILTDAIRLALEGLNMDKVYELKDTNKTEELYKYLLITQCNALSVLLPGMFQKIEDYTELLLPDYLLREGSVMEQMVARIPEEDWSDQVQIIGWLYQYYNTEPKDAVFAALKKNVKISKENIPAATQLFTPDWIVRYMVENSLGRLWLEGHPDDALKSEWKYYLEEAEQEPEVEAELTKIRAEYAQLTPEDIRCIDPCQGSGHILVYLFDVLMQIYETYGYTTQEAAASIVQNNIYGLDIDERAAQLSYFAVMMKACQYDRRFLKRKDEEGNPKVPQPRVYAIRESNEIDRNALEYFCNDDVELKEAMETILEEMQDAKEYGSIITVTEQKWDAIYARFEEIGEDISIYKKSILELFSLVQVAQALSQKYHVVVTNPPYMGSGGMSEKISNYVKSTYPDNKADLYAVFIAVCEQLCNSYGKIGMMTSYTWMFLSSFEKTRVLVQENHSLQSLIQPEYHAFFEAAYVPICTFVICMGVEKYIGKYIQLKDFYGSEIQSIKVLEAIKEQDCKYLYTASSKDFKQIYGAPIAYWASKKLIEAFSHPLIGEIAKPRQGLATGENDKFTRLWFEVDQHNISFDSESREMAVQSGRKWFPYNKGGEFRKWYGNNDYIVNWKDDGKEIRGFKDNKNKLRSRPQNMDYYFQPSITWSKISSGSIAFRYKPAGHIFDVAGTSIFVDNENRQYVHGFCNSVVALKIAQLLSPTLNYEVGHIASFPVNIDVKYKKEITDLVEKNILICKEDWDSFETSWDFQRHPIVQAYFDNTSYQEKGLLPERNPHRIQDCYIQWATDCNLRFATLKRNEEELNRIFIEIYGLQDELTPEVEDKDVTVRKADKQRDIKSLISYAVGCMFGRYSIYKQGLVYAGGDFDEVYGTFPVEAIHLNPDSVHGTAFDEYGAPADTYHRVYLKNAEHMDDAGMFWGATGSNIIPISDDEYFTDDMVEQFIDFIRIVYGEESLDTNLAFIADALGGKGQPREVIRNYFINDFYQDHCKIYQKRPIYWLFDSGKKNGFKCLIYMHRYQPDTIARIRTDYVHEQQSRYRTAIADLEKRISGAATSDRVKLNKQLTKLQAQATEIREYEEKIHHLADQMIRIDLDDGVKVNYAKFQDVLAKIK